MQLTAEYVDFTQLIFEFSFFGSKASFLMFIISTFNVEICRKLIRQDYELLHKVFQDFNEFLQSRVIEFFYTCYRKII